MIHPLALSPNRFTGANGMKSGERVRYMVDGRCGVVNEFLHDGDALVTFDDGSFETIKWRNLQNEQM